MIPTISVIKRDDFDIIDPSLDSSAVVNPLRGCPTAELMNIINGVYYTRTVQSACMKYGLLLLYRFDTENGPAHGLTAGSGRSLSVTHSSGYSFPQRRESFLYRSDSDFELSPKSGGSRNSSLTSEQ